MVYIPNLLVIRTVEESIKSSVLNHPSFWLLYTYPL
jgi:hypothetical protein